MLKCKKNIYKPIAIPIFGLYNEIRETKGGHQDEV